ncbi:MAG TPA: hypothetical protein VFA85_02440 [Terriglobales bacterium]|nr:hypothetical protein [Terriglobales bacterium]
MTRNATYIFLGRIEKERASNLAIVPATDATALVKIQKVLSRPGNMPDFSNQMITLKLITPGTLKNGESMIFFTNVWLYGENLALEEVAHTSAEDKTANTASIEKTGSEAENVAIENRVRLAAAVIVGRVVTVRALQKDSNLRPMTEHDPEWQLAEIAVESTLKGTPGAKVSLLFPNSRDVAWFQSPKFRVGQEGVWILQEQKSKEVTSAIGKPVYTALDALDFRPKSEMQRIKKLVLKRD